MLSVAKVPENAKVGWQVLLLVLRIDWETIGPELVRLCEEMRVLQKETSVVIKTMEGIQEKIEPLLQTALELKNDTAPLWEDTYNLCGNPRCFGDCAICLDGEEDYEEDATEKYCRRGRR